MATIDILSVIDCQSIVDAVAAGKISGAGTLQSPTSLGSWATSDAYVYMITCQSFTDDSQATSELNVNANVGDTMRWTVTCPGDGLAYNAIIAGVNIGSGTSISAPVAQAVNLHFYDLAGSPGYQVVENTVYTSTVQNTSGQTQYIVIFQIMDNMGNNLGYYFWDPFITPIATPAFQAKREALKKSLKK